jgi:DASH complex subunit Hsk3 like
MSSISSAVSPATAAKERHYAHLAAILSKLTTNVEIARDHVEEAARQSDVIARLACGQASL